MAPFIAAIRFLTVFPLPGSYGSGSDDLAASIPFFPVVGLALGALASLLGLLFWSLLPHPVASTMITFILFAVSGGFHLDGLADTADGFFSARPREQMLAIMRDSHIGVMGVLALIMVLLLKFSALAALDRPAAVRAAFLMPIAGRCAIVIFMALLPYARAKGGLATLFYSNRSRRAGIWAFLFFGVIAMLTCGLTGILVLLLFAGIIAVFAWMCKRKINGATGDTLGAICELSEAGVALAVSLAYWSH